MHRANPVRTLLVASAAFVMCIASAGAQEPGGSASRPAQASPQAPAQESLVTRTYDVTDLVRPVKNYPAAPRSSQAAGGPGAGQALFGGGVGGAPESVGPSERPAINVDALVKMIVDTIDPTGWRVNGGANGSISPLGNLLVVTQTAQNQREIENLLTTLRAEQGPLAMLSVRAYWVLLDPQEIRDAFAGSAKEQENPAAGAGGRAVRAMPTIDEKLLDKSHLYCQGQTICFSGQTVHVTSGREWSAVTGVSPVVASNAVGYDPQTGRVQSGVSLQVTPQLVPKADAVILDLQSQVTETRTPSAPIDLSNIPATQHANPAEVRAAASGLIDRIDVANQELAMTVRLPTGKPVLLGGMTLSPGSNDQQARQLYLVVQVDAVR